MAGTLQQLTDNLLGLLFPDRCIGCRRVGALLCRACAAQLPRYPARVLLSLPAPVPPYLREVRVVYTYQGVLRQAVHALKYEGQRRMALPLGTLLAAYLHEQPMPADAIIPVPLHTHRLQQRGFNQSALLGRVLADSTNIPLVTGRLARLRDTPSQVGLNMWQRQTNMHAAFVWRGTAAAPARVLLLDDVLTTGATTHACAEVLHAAGVREVRVLALARSMLSE